MLLPLFSLKEPLFSIWKFVSYLMFLSLFSLKELFFSIWKFYSYPMLLSLFSLIEPLSSIWIFYSYLMFLPALKEYCPPIWKSESDMIFHPLFFIREHCRFTYVCMYFHSFPSVLVFCFGFLFWFSVLVFCFLVSITYEHEENMR